MNKGHQGNGYSQQSEEIGELIAWQGYEFWSAQIEAEMEIFANPEQTAFALNQFESREGKNDVLPF